MNRYTYENIEVGTSESFSCVITDDLMDDFLRLSEDKNPLHTNSSFAKEKGFKDVVVYGMLVSSFYSKLVGMYLPGENCILNRCSVDFLHPVYIGDKLIVSGRVVDKRDSTQRLYIKAKTNKFEGGLVNKANIVVSFSS